MDFLISCFLFIVTPCAMTAWFTTRFRSPLKALFVTWAMSPIMCVVVTVVVMLVLKPLTPDNNETVKTMTYFIGPLPPLIAGFVAGPIAGIVAAVVVDRRRRKELAKSDVSDESGSEAQSKQ